MTDWDRPNVTEGAQLTLRLMKKWADKQKWDWAAYYAFKLPQQDNMPGVDGFITPSNLPNLRFPIEMSTPVLFPTVSKAIGAMTEKDVVDYLGSRTIFNTPEAGNAQVKKKAFMDQVAAQLVKQRLAGFLLFFQDPDKNGWDDNKSSVHIPYTDSNPNLFGTYPNNSIPNVWYDQMRLIEANVTKQIIEHSDTPSGVPYPNTVDDFLKNATVVHDFVVNNNEWVNYKIPGVDLSTYGLSKQSVELAVAGALPLAWYCEHNNNYVPLVLYTALAPLGAFFMTRAFHESLDFNLGSFNASGSGTVNEISNAAQTVQTSIAIYLQKWYAKTVLVSGIAVGTLYYYYGNPVVFKLWGASLVLLPWLLGAASTFIEDHPFYTTTFAGSAVTTGLVGAIYHYDLLPNNMLPYIAVGGFGVTVVSATIAWLATASAADIAQTIGDTLAIIFGGVISEIVAAFGGNPNVLTGGGGKGAKKA